MHSHACTAIHALAGGRRWRGDEVIERVTAADGRSVSYYLLHGLYYAGQSDWRALSPKTKLSMLCKLSPASAMKSTVMLCVRACMRARARPTWMEACTCFGLLVHAHLYLYYDAPGHAWSRWLCAKEVYASTSAMRCIQLCRWGM